MENIVVLGSTGSIGRNTIDIISRIDSYSLIGISFNSNIKEAEKQIQRFSPKFVCCGKKEDAKILSSKYKNTNFLHSEDGLVGLASLQDADIIVNALVGTSGLIPTYYILKNKKKLALANKESLVIAGKLFSKMSQDSKNEIIPIDSEHSAIYQCLENRNKDSVNSIILTASGGPFFHKEDFSSITKKDALNHPTWSMGEKITIDSATMMNKGFEIIEAKWLFGIDYDKIKVVIHKESIMHSAVEFKDGSIIAQLGAHDMRIPISYALTKPDRLELEFKIDLTNIESLHFEKPNFDKFHTLQLAYDALKKQNKNLGLILNAADEVAVESFLNNKIKFIYIFEILERACRIFEDNLPENIFAIKQQTEYIKNEVKNLIKKDFIGG
jgi:1-deoxy-D-xylulose-5-phosphate reductoisomerase